MKRLQHVTFRPWGMTMRFVLGIVLLGLMCGPARSAQQFLCLGDKSTGFKWNGTEWAITKFSTKDDRFILQEKQKPLVWQGRTFTYEVKRFGDRQAGELLCEANETSGNLRLICGGLGSGILFDSGSMRFHELYGLGYVDGKDAPGNTPALTIGTCTRLR